jgi:hypothetical protein
MTGRVVAGRYNLQHPIGRGAMGVVWRARDQLLDRDVAVKEVVISALIGADERRNAYQRTLREARTAARLSHRGVVAVYDVAEEDGRPWIIMELVPSRSLDQVLIMERQVTPVRTGRIGQQLLSALAAAHMAGVLHRDVKPSNVLIATDRSGSGWDERAVLTDFGIAQFEGDPRLTQTGMVMGSPGFTAPERIRGGDATPASDLWSLGATLYTAVEGRGPYEQRGGAITTMSAIINEDAPVAAHAGPLGPVIAALMRREPSARPSASAAARMFARVLPQLIEDTDRPHKATQAATVRSPAAPQPQPSAAAPSAAPALPAESRFGDSALVAEHAATAEQAAAPEPASASGLTPPGPADPADAADAADSTPEVAAETVAPEAEDPARESPPEPEPAPAGEAEAASEPAAAAPVPGLAAESDEAAEAADDPLGSGDLAESGDPEEAGAAKAAPVMSPEAAPVSQARETVIDRRPSARETVIDRGSQAGETVIDRRPAEHRPTELDLPVAKPTPARPTFTASQPKERAVPTFSAARHDQPGATPAEPPAAYGAPEAGGSPHGPYLGTTSPFAGSAGQYAGPSQPHADLASQYTPGKGGGRAQRRRRGPVRLVVLVICAVVLAVAIGAGAAYALGHHGAGTGASGSGKNGSGKNGSGTSGSGTVPDPKTAFLSVNALNTPSAATPAGWTHEQVTAAQAHAHAGFTIDLPPGWKKLRQGLANDFAGPRGLFLEVDLTPHKHQNMPQEAQYIAGQAAPNFIGYRLLHLEPVPVRSTKGALWQFKRTLSGVLVTADDILFIEPTPAGNQSYAVYIRGPASGWGDTYLPIFDRILPTFQTLPATT